MKETKEIYKNPKMKVVTLKHEHPTCQTGSPLENYAGRQLTGSDNLDD